MEKIKDSVLAEGEATGHSHKILEGLQVLKTLDDTRVFEVTVGEKKYGCTVVHEEHDKIEIPNKPQVYESDQVQEWDSFKEEAQRVVD